MKYIFFGTPEFAAIILEKLIKAGFVPLAVVCNPDKPVGRKKIITPPPIKKLLIEKLKDCKIEILQPDNLSYLISHLSSFNPDVFIVAAYAKILPKEILDIPRLGTIGVHPSLLPKYRGSSPIQTAILNGDKETGTTLYLMDEGLDSGNIVASSKHQVLSDDNYESLMKKLAELSADLLIKTLPDIEEKIKNALMQDGSQATYTKKFKTEDAFIEPKDLEKVQNSTGIPQETWRLAIEIDRKIRALNPEPGTFTLSLSKGKPRRIKLLEAVLTQEGKLKLKKIQFEGKKPIDI